MKGPSGTCRRNATPSRPPRMACQRMCSLGVGCRRMTRARGSSRAPDERADLSDLDKADSHLPVEVTERSPRRTIHDARKPPVVSHHRSAADVTESTLARHAACATRSPVTSTGRWESVTRRASLRRSSKRADACEPFRGRDPSPPPARSAAVLRGGREYALGGDRAPTRCGAPREGRHHRRTNAAFDATLRAWLLTT